MHYRNAKFRTSKSNALHASLCAMASLWLGSCSGDPGNESTPSPDAPDGEPTQGAGTNGSHDTSADPTGTDGAGQPSNGGSGTNAVTGTASTTTGGATDGSSSANGNGSSDDSGQQTPPAMGSDAAATACSQLGEGTHAGVTKLRRLTQAQFNNTVRDLLGLDERPASAFALDERIGPFQSNAVAPVTPLLVQQHDEVALSLAARATAQMPELAQCDLATEGEPCATQFIVDFGRKTYRRPLQDVERASYLALWRTGLSEGGVEDAFELVVSTMLSSPNFVYHVDSGISAASDDTVELTAYELASRLSYFLWNTMPDDTLFELADSGMLSDEAVLVEQVERMLADDKASDAIPDFHLQLLGIGELGSVSKDAAMFPQFDEALADAMMQETSRFSDYVVRQGDGLMSTLFSASYSFPQGPLFDVYGLAEPQGFTPGDAVELDATRRAGLLTQPAFLTRHAHPNQTSPVHRGMVLRENLLCTPIQSPPPDVDNVPPQPTEATTTRERFAQHSSDPSCAGCHVLMDPIGLTFEHYDPIGAWRDEDGRSAVDASGEVIGGQGTLGGPVNGAVELAQKLADSDQVAECLANQWFRFALGRIESTDDACTMQQVHTSFSASGRNVRDLIGQLVLSDAFRHVRYLDRATALENQR